MHFWSSLIHDSYLVSVGSRAVPLREPHPVEIGVVSTCFTGSSHLSGYFYRIRRSVSEIFRSQQSSTLAGFAIVIAWQTNPPHQSHDHRCLSTQTFSSSPSLLSKQFFACAEHPNSRSSLTPVLRVGLARHEARSVSRRSRTTSVITTPQTGNLARQHAPHL